MSEYLVNVYLISKCTLNVVVDPLASFHLHRTLIYLFTVSLMHGSLTQFRSFWIVNPSTERMNDTVLDYEFIAGEAYSLDWAFLALDLFSRQTFSLPWEKLMSSLSSCQCRILHTKQNAKHRMHRLTLKGVASMLVAVHKLMWS